MNIINRFLSSALNDLYTIISSLLEGFYKGTLFYAASLFILFVSFVADNPTEFFSYLTHNTDSNKLLFGGTLEIIKYYSFCIIAFSGIFLLKNTLNRGKHVNKNSFSHGAGASHKN